MRVTINNESAEGGLVPATRGHTIPCSTWHSSPYHEYRFDNRRGNDGKASMVVYALFFHLQTVIVHLELWDGTFYFYSFSFTSANYDSDLNDMPMAMALHDG